MISSIMTVNNKERSVGNHKICQLLNLQGDVSLQKFTIHSDMAQLIELTGSNQNHTHIGLPRHHKLTFMKFVYLLLHQNVGCWHSISYE